MNFARVLYKKKSEVGMQISYALNSARLSLRFSMFPGPSLPKSCWIFCRLAIVSLSRGSVLRNPVAHSPERKSPMTRLSLLSVFLKMSNSRSSTLMAEESLSLQCKLTRQSISIRNENVHYY